MPKPPNGVLQRLNYIADFFFDPCDAPLTLYATTMLPALLEAAILWYSPVPEEIFTAWARPSRAIGRYRSRRKGTRGSKAGKKGPKSRLGRIINFDVNEYIGKRLPGAELLGNATFGRLTFGLWTIFGFLQFLGLIWLVWEVVSGFFAKWFSLLYETEYCKETVAAVLYSTGGGYLIGNIVEHNGFIALNVQKQRGPVSVTIGGGTIGVSNGTCIAAASFEGDAPEGTWVEVQIWEGSVGPGNLRATNRSGVFETGLRQAAAAYTFPRSTTFVVTLRTNVGLLFITSTTLSIHGGASQ